MDPYGRYPTKSDFAYSQVRNRIMTGDYPPGSVVNQAALAADLGISTTPLREGLHRLMSEGLIELDAHRDARVTELSAEEARSLLEIRRALDPLAAGLAAERRTKTDLAGMRAALADRESLPGSPVADRIAHRRFHRAMYCASHNDLLIAALDGLWDRTDRYLLAGVAQQPKGGEDDELFAAVAAGDSSGAERLMLGHIPTALRAG